MSEPLTSEVLNRVPAGEVLQALMTARIRELETTIEAKDLENAALRATIGRSAITIAQMAMALRKHGLPEAAGELETEATNLATALVAVLGG